MHYMHVKPILPLRTNIAAMSNNQLRATYQSPDSSEAFSSDLPSLPSDPKAQDVKSKTAYLAALRSSITQMRGDVNGFLTKKMEDSRATDSGKTGTKKSKEEKAEEMYGEEDPEADA